MPLPFMSLVLAGVLSFEYAPQAGTQRAVPQFARISGRVIEEGTNAPLSGVRVTAILMERGPIVSSPIGPPPQTLTAGDGVTYSMFHLAGIRIDAQKAGFASPLADPSAFRTFELAAGQSLVGLNISMPKSAVIAGQILDPFSGSRWWSDGPSR